MPKKQAKDLIKYNQKADEKTSAFFVANSIRKELLSLFNW